MVRGILSSVAMSATLSFVLHVSAVACEASKERLIYGTAFAEEDPAWEFSDIMKVSPDGLSMAPEPSSSQMNIYQGDFIDNAVVCASVALVQGYEEKEFGGILFWAKDYAHNYLFEINPRSGLFYVGRRVGDQLAFPIVQKRSEAVKKGVDELNELAVSLNEDVAILYINGTQVGMIKGQSWSEGNKVGVISESSDKGRAMWRFGEFQVTRLAK